MNVAKTYKDWAVDGEPFFENNKCYVYVINPKTEKPRKVRVYSEAAYARMYPEEVKKEVFKSQKEVLGFIDGYITIFKGNTYPYKDWFKANGATYTRHWGWSFASDKEVPADLPSEITPVELKWESVGDSEQEKLYNDEIVKSAVEALIFDKGNSDFVGEVGERLELWLTVKKTHQTEGYYGYSTIHIMEDEDENTFVWITSSKSMEEGAYVHLRGTVKEHKTFRNQAQTVLTRCTLVK